MHLFVFLHTHVINLCAITGLPNNDFLSSVLHRASKARHEMRESCFSFPGLFFVLQQQAGLDCYEQGVSHPARPFPTAPANLASQWGTLVFEG